MPLICASMLSDVTTFVVFSKFLAFLMAAYHDPGFGCRGALELVIVRRRPVFGQSNRLVVCLTYWRASPPCSVQLSVHVFSDYLLLWNSLFGHPKSQWQKMRPQNGERETPTWRERLRALLKLVRCCCCFFFVQIRCQPIGEIPFSHNFPIRNSKKKHVGQHNERPHSSLLFKCIAYSSCSCCMFYWNFLKTYWILVCFKIKFDPCCSNEHTSSTEFDQNISSRCSVCSVDHPSWLDLLGLFIFRLHRFIPLSLSHFVFYFLV